MITDIGVAGVPQEYVNYFNEASTIFNIPNWCLAAVANKKVILIQIPPMEVHME